MKKLFIFCLLTLFVFSLSAQEQDTVKAEEPKKAYEIIYKINIDENVEFRNLGKKASSITVVYRAVGTQTKSNVRDFKIVNMEDGQMSRAIPPTQSVEFPFWGKLTFKSSKGLSEMEFKIYEQGYWQIILTTL
ncbi:MAG: hypothetical protein KAW86_06575 [Bacteroidales bacterium]|nr:hypothetical protein [Bacteroidales bacterium]